jgi:hypothetical protein
MCQDNRVADRYSYVNEMEEWNKDVSEQTWVQRSRLTQEKDIPHGNYSKYRVILIP